MSLPRKKSSGHMSSPTQFIHDLKKLDEVTKVELSELTPTCYVHFRENGAALKETKEESPRTRHVQKMLRRTVRMVNPIDQTISLNEPVEATVQSKERSEDCLDTSDLKLFQEYLNKRMALLETHNPSMEKLDQKPIHSPPPSNEGGPSINRRSPKMIRPVSTDPSKL